MNYPRQLVTAEYPRISREPHALPQAPAEGGQRIAALDFTKGALVLLMVLYHWLNYFVSVEGAYYKYLRFLTPSFIFITGFLVSHVYFRKYGVTNSRLPKRLLQRGMKLLGVFVFLNLAIGFLFRGSIQASFAEWAHLLVGDSVARRASFAILVPIGYVLVFSAGLSFVSRLYRHAFHVASVMLFVCALILGFIGFANAYLELISIGLLGVSIGFIPTEWGREIAARLHLVLLGYVGYLCLLTVWREVFLLQIAGVVLTLALIYWLGSGDGYIGARSAVILLGRYSLFSYIVHIVILQALHAAARHVGPEVLAAGLSLPGAAFLTLLSVAVVDRTRSKVEVVNRLYVAVFA